MKSPFSLLILVVVLASAAVVSGAETLTSRDFGYGYMLELRETSAVYSLLLPQAVYTKVRRADLGDIRVFNGAGEPVPHGLRKVKQDDVALIADIPFFPLHTSGSDGDDLSLKVSRNSAGTIISLDNRFISGNHVEPYAYLLDLGNNNEDVGSLEIFWKSDATHASSNVRVEQSDDLQRWSQFVHKATLVDLVHGGNQVVKRNIYLPGKAQRYLRFSWLDGSGPLPVTRIRAYSHPLASKINLHWVTLFNGGKKEENNKINIDYVSDYRLPARHARLAFADDNAIVNALIQSRADEDEAWRTRCKGVFFSIAVEGQTLQSEPCSFAVTTDRQWRIVVNDDGAGLSGRQGGLLLELGWQSDELLFVARGTPPYILAYGSGKLEAAAEQVPSGMVLETVRQQGVAVVKPAYLGKRIELGGERALVPPNPPKPWKTWVLWGLLVLGVLLMAYMTVSLARDLRNKDGVDKES